jgi:tRNA-splicing ligase RtcB
MPDVHLARGVCVGTAFATTRLAYPEAVGGDIGCGMATVALCAGAGDLADGDALAKLHAKVGEYVPVIRHPSGPGRRSAPDMKEADLSDPALAKLAAREGLSQFGTLGRGNHFLEFQADADGGLWIMVHSGSRAVGQAILAHHLARSTARSAGLAALDTDTEFGQAYMNDLAWARAWARRSRRAMLEAAARAARDVLGARAEDAILDCDHNHARFEEHFGQRVLVHRKGVVPASEGEAGLLPGSMAAPSFHVVGRGEPESLRSSAHGAGRALSRSEARRTISRTALAKQLRGVWVDQASLGRLTDEAPGAYKNIREVLRAQRALVKVTREVRPLLTYKG